MSNLEPSLTVIEDSIVENNVSEIVSKIEDIARPLVGQRSKSNEYWWSYPMIVVYLAIDTSLDGRKGKYLYINCGSI